LGDRGLAGILVEEKIAPAFSEVARLPVALRQRIEERFAAWKGTWRDPQMAFSSNTKTCSRAG
jgi:hypothetical protein